jgi:hypothetical protein
MAKPTELHFLNHWSQIARVNTLFYDAKGKREDGKLWVNRNETVVPTLVDIDDIVA